MKDFYQNFMMTLVGLLAVLVVLRSCLPEPKPSPPAREAVSPALTTLPCTVAGENTQMATMTEEQLTEQRRKQLLARYNALQQRLEQH